MWWGAKGLDQDGLNIPNLSDIEKGLGTRICNVIWLESQFCENLDYLFLI